MTLSINDSQRRSIECQYAECPVFLLLCWVSLYWVPFAEYHGAPSKPVLTLVNQLRNSNIRLFFDVQQDIRKLLVF